MYTDKEFSQHIQIILAPIHQAVRAIAVQKNKITAEQATNMYHKVVNAVILTAWAIEKAVRAQLSYLDQVSTYHAFWTGFMQHICFNAANFIIDRLFTDLLVHVKASPRYVRQVMSSIFSVIIRQSPLSSKAKTLSPKKDDSSDERQQKVGKVIQ